MAWLAGLRRELAAVLAGALVYCDGGVGSLVRVDADTIIRSPFG